MSPGISGPSESPPFFSIIVPTTGKPHLVENAINSILRQDFTDFELLVVDNDSMNKTRERISQFDDRRIRYLRTGNLNMPDNWQYAIERTKGHFTTILTDRMLFATSNSLRKIYTHITEHDVPIASWAWGMYEETTGRISNTPANLSHRCGLVRNFRFVEAFLMGDLDWTIYRMPKLLNACIHRNLLQELMNTYGRICNPCSPDYAFAFLVCLHFPHQSTLCIDETIILSSFFNPEISNGAGTASDYSKLRTYISSFGSSLNAEQIAHTMLLKNFTQINTLYYDLFNAAKITGKTIHWTDTNLIYYFIENYRQIKQLRNNPLRGEWLANFWETLAAQEPIVEQNIRKQLRLIDQPQWKSKTTYKVLRRIIQRLLQVMARMRHPVRDVQSDAIPHIEESERDPLRQYYERLFWSTSFRSCDGAEMSHIPSRTNINTE